MICRFHADLKRGVVSAFPIMLKRFAGAVRARYIEVNAVVLERRKQGRNPRVTMGDATGETGELTLGNTERNETAQSLNTRRFY
jgi:hypothetical protein